MITPTRPETAIAPQAPMRRRLNVERIVDPRVARRLFFDDDRNVLERQNTIPLTVINEEVFPIATPQPLTRQNTIPLDWAPRPARQWPRSQSCPGESASAPWSSRPPCHRCPRAETLHTPPPTPRPSPYPAPRQSPTPTPVPPR